MPQYQKYPTGDQKWQLLKNFTLFGCGPTWAVYFETLLPAIGEMLLMLLSTSVTDVARATFKPKHPGFHHKRRGRKGRRGAAGFPQTEEIIADFIGGDGLIDAERYSAGTQHLWRLDALAQEFGLYMLVADAFDEFWFAWISGIIARGPSNCGVTHMTRTGGGDITGTGSGEWVPINLATLVSETNCLSSAGGVALNASTYNMVLSGTVRNSGLYGNPAQYQVRFYNESNPPGEYTYSNRVQLWPGETASLVAQAVVTTGRGTHWECAHFGIAGQDSPGDFTNMEMRIADLGMQSFNPPPPPRH